MKKYWAIFKISWQRQLTYRLNLLMGRLRNIIVLLLLYYVWLSLTLTSGKFSSYSQIELFTYVFGANLLRSVIFGSQSRQTASEINDGTFSIYLLRPLNHFGAVFARELAERSLYLFFAVIETLVLAFLLGVKFAAPAPATLSPIILCVLLSLCLYFVLSYLVSMLAFWTREADGPRFLFEWLLEFSSGAYFPLDILRGLIFTALSCLPFFYLIYFPLSIYLGKIAHGRIWLGLGIETAWLALSLWLIYVVWRRGLKKFTGEGI